MHSVRQDVVCNPYCAVCATLCNVPNAGSASGPDNKFCLMGKLREHQAQTKHKSCYRAAAGAKRNVNTLNDTCASGQYCYGTHQFHLSDPTKVASGADGVIYTQGKSACTPTQCAPETLKSCYSDGQLFLIL